MLRRILAVLSIIRCCPDIGFIDDMLICISLHKPCRKQLISFVLPSRWMFLYPTIDIFTEDNHRILSIVRNKIKSCLKMHSAI